MIQMDTRELCQAVKGKLIAGLNSEFIGVSIDSRKIESGQLFIAIIGEKLDGHKFVKDALENGGIGAVVDREMDIHLKQGQFLVRVDDTTQALQNLAHHYRKKFNLKVIGITGSVGKTTTKDMIAAVLGSRYNVLKTEGNLNNYYGLPLTLFKIKPEHQILVVEMGMSALKEIELLARLAEPEFGVVTNVGYSHMEYLRTLDNVQKAKQELIENLIGDQIAILNVDDERVRRMALLAKKVIFYGFKKADYQAVEIEEKIELQGSKIVVQAEGEKREFFIPIPGEHNVYNALAAIATGRTLGVSFNAIQEGLNTFKPSKMRMNITRTNNGITVLNDVYNANPASMQAALKVLAKYKGRKIAVLGDMLELGQYTESAHRELGMAVVKHGVQLMFVKGDYRHIVAEGAKLAGLGTEKIFTCSTNSELGQKLIQMIRPGDIILVKGSRGMVMEEIVNTLVGEV